MSTQGSASVMVFEDLEVRPDDVYLEIGFGRGDACARAAESGADVIGVEILPDRVDALIDRLRGCRARSVRGIASDCAPIPLPDATASVIVCNEVLEHVPDTAGFLAEIVRVGKPGARYWISVPDPRSERLMGLVCTPDYFQAPNHLHVFEPGRLTAAVEAAGLAIRGRRFVGFEHAMWWILRMTSGTDHLPSSAEPRPEILAAWESVWRLMLGYPRGHEIARELSGLLPKSQILVADKPPHPVRFDPPARGFTPRLVLNRLARRLRPTARSHGH